MAIVRVVVHGKGCVHLWPNKGSVCSTAKDVNFAIGERADFRASPDEGWTFVRFCNGETPPYCIPDWAFQWVIDVPYGEVHAFFSATPDILINEERKQRIDADDRLRASIEATRSWAEGEFMDAIESVQDAYRGIETEVQDRMKAIADVEARIRSWIADSIFELLMKNLNAAAVEYRKQRGRS